MGAGTPASGSRQLFLMMFLSEDGCFFQIKNWATKKNPGCLGHSIEIYLERERRGILYIIDNMFI